MSKCPPRAPAFVAGWIILCAFCNCAGWILSALHQLNATGYAVCFGSGLVAVAAWWKLGGQGSSKPQPSGSVFAALRLRPLRLRHRFRRAFPLGFLILVLLAILGGVLHAPTNYDGLTYRIPRVLHWLAEGQWHWIHTEFMQLNTRATGIEWVSAPLICITGTDRWLFLINVAAFLMLPGLIFSLFTRLGIRPRVAWHWMWLLPTGYGFLLQAGSIGNDLFGAVFALAAVDFALRGRGASGAASLWLSILAAGLLTGSKASNLPLLLPWLVAMVPSLPRLRRNLGLTTVVVAVALVASFLPSAVANVKHCGDWTGLAAESAHALKGQGAVKVVNNLVLLTIQNLVPSVFPLASAWNRAVQNTMPASWRATLERNFEPVGAHWSLGEMQLEEDSDLGFGVTALCLAGLAAGSFGGYRSPTKSTRGSAGVPMRELWPRVVVWSAVAALLVFMAKSGMSTAARLMLPYYALCLPALLMAPSQARVLRAGWWRGAALAVFGAGALLTIISPARPLWPVKYLQASLNRADEGISKRVKTVYAVYGQRSNCFAPARELLPPGLKVLGLMTSDDPETSLWRPFGQRRVKHVKHTDSLADLQARGIHYVLANEPTFEHLFKRPLAQWLTEMDGKIAGKTSLQLRASAKPSDWVLISLGTPKPK